MKKILLVLAVAFSSAVSFAQQDPNKPFSLDEVFVDQEPYYEFSEMLPTFKFGADSLNRLIAKTVEYPEVDRQMGIEGTVMVSFVIETDGHITDIAIKKGVTLAMNTEAVRAVMKTDGMWNPGTIDDAPVRVMMILPVKFYLGGDNAAKFIKTDALLPVYEAGINAFYNEIEKNLIYPEDAKKNKIIGRVRIKCQIDENGKLSQPELLDYIYPTIDQEALRIVTLFSGKFLPTKMNGQPVREVIVPIDFTLKKWSPKKDTLLDLATKDENNGDYWSAYNHYLQLYWLDSGNGDAAAGIRTCKTKLNL
ncbi:MAG: energy transducer TonB [Flavobacteriales bacterium]